MKNNYSESFRLYYLWLVVANISTAAIMAGGPVVGLPVDVSVIMGLVVNLIINILAVWMFGKNYPGADTTGQKWLAGILGVFRVGYDQPGINNLPWKIILTYGLVAVFVNREIATLFMQLGSNIGSISILAAAVIIVTLVAIVVAFTIGFLTKEAVLWIREYREGRNG